MQLCISLFRISSTIHEIRTKETNNKIFLVRAWLVISLVRKNYAKFAHNGLLEFQLLKILGFGNLGFPVRVGILIPRI